jgi:hypothetical protein
MPIDPEVLFLLARDYAKSMTSIRGRRVQRLLRREFSGAEHVVMIEASSGTPAVLGVSAIGAAFCSTSGKGKQVSVIKWLHGSTEAIETHFDLLKDSLPVLSATSLPLADLRGRVSLHAAEDSVPSQARALVSLALHAVK